MERTFLPHVQIGIYVEEILGSASIVLFSPTVRVGVVVLDSMHS